MTGAVGEAVLLGIAAPVMLFLSSDAIRSWLERRRQGRAMAGFFGTPEPGRNGSPGTLARQLRAAGLRIGPGTFLLGTLLLALLVPLGILDRFPGAHGVAALATAVTVYVCFTAVRDLAQWRGRRFETQLSDAIDLLVGSLTGGQNPLQAMEATAEASGGAIRREFREVGDRLYLGMTIQQAVARMAMLYDSEGVRLFTHTLVAKWQTGGDLAPVLSSVNQIIRERLKLRLHLQSQLAGARLSSIFVAVLPYALVPFFLWRQPQWVSTLLYHPQGPTLLFLAVCLQLIGFLWIRRLLRIEL